MQLTVWTYEGPPHIGAMRVATAMEGLHYVLHAPQGDTYADLLFTMIERRAKRPPVTYTTFQAQDLGRDTAAIFKDAVAAAYERFQPQAMIVGASCTAELIQDDPGGLAKALALPIPVIPLELPAYQKKENWGASETFYRLVRALAGSPAERSPRDGRRPACNILGPTALGFRHRDDLIEVRRLLDGLGIAVNVVAPLGATPADLVRLGEADFNVVLYPEVARSAAQYLEKTFHQPFVDVVPIGVGATTRFVEAVAALAGVDPAPVLADAPSRLPWYSRSVDSTYLTGKRVFVFGDATHALALARVAAHELGFKLVGLGTYTREFAREVRAEAALHGIEATITDDYLDVEAAIQAAAPELVLGTQMERHIAKRLSIPCAVISAPIHVQDFPARHSPQMGFEGANVLFDTLVHPLMMGLEEHLLGMFREDPEFHDGAAPSHLGRGPNGTADAVERAPKTPPLASAPVPSPIQIEGADAVRTAPWAPDAEKELKKIPFFVRGKARANTERFARERQLPLITLETLYDAKAHFGR
ncbi:ferredoxin:protochlorophyllide reductase (ATP-dependent) subunit B [Methylorubrum extorquens]|uniref:ferredoxin:protochlorophyllide reductase (ATP-dependent) subunit B n=1 Tax=Methylorubrum extorquens TaxID=408 RepID=UPI000158FB5C|nr:ferredoxin:protochlorophyllide reductase (ATP-dependent) subunit B [Methylorubrum extorquens]ABY33183.1 light-independent protochlorophyllide reductase, B subunit [Methylorubrum extorquens PA1]KQP86398.1 light-independent protochlorophyllide reductase subunit B [Methylobacterium sp. Leaf119]WIU39758.1 ferredoxin:protochlorophyllide reductase (ATP-dependent) subunit B [Methylorubrum extorquens]